MADKDLADKFVSGTMKATGWTRDFSGDILGTAGGGAIVFLLMMWFTGQLLLLINPFLWISVGVSALVTAMLWKRARRDNN